MTVLRIADLSTLFFYLPCELKSSRHNKEWLAEVKTERFFVRVNMFLKVSIKIRQNSK